MKETERNQDTPIHCTNCGAPIQIKPGAEYASCTYCGASYTVSDLLNESEEIQIQKMKNKSTKERLEYAKKNTERWITEDRAKHFQKSLLSFVLIGLAFGSIIFGLSAFALKSPVSGVIGLVQMVLFLVAWMMGSQIIREKKAFTHKVVTIVGLLLAVPFVLCYSSPNEIRTEAMDWDSIVLRQYLPKPENVKKVIVRRNDLDSIWMDLLDQTPNDFSDYVQACKDVGYNQEIASDGTAFKAFNQDGYSVELFYYRSDKILTLTFKTPIILGDLEWPSFIENVPKPDSQVGALDWMDGNNFIIYVGDISRKEFLEYCNGLADYGFTENQYQNDGDFMANNSDGDMIDVHYEGNQIIRIRYEEKAE